MRSSGRGRWRAALGAAALLAAVPVTLTIPSVVAAPRAADGPCTGNDGVTVVVDFGTLGGGMQTRCAPEPVGSGFEALTKAGFTYEGTTRFPGLLCRIDGKPSPQQDACYNAPPPRFYWAYWTAPAAGGAWTYSDAGAGNREPPPGSVDGWAFSDGCTRKPGAATTCPSGTTTTTVVTSPTTTSGTATPGVTTATRRPATTTSAALASDHSSGDAADPAIAEPAASDDASVSDSQSALGDVDRAGTNTNRRSGSPAGVVVGAAVVGLLGLGAAMRVRARRASSSGQGAE